VRDDIVVEVIAIFEQLHRLRYPIEKIRTVDRYPAADDELSMEDNNTSVQLQRHPRNRPVVSARLRSSHRPQPASQPVHRPRGRIPPKNAGPYLDRSRIDPGLLHDGDPAVHVFTDRGWRWGGYWRTPIDYQHFERP
jgi:D-alanyl-D-alanine carboxypeptidase